MFRNKVRIPYQEIEVMPGVSIVVDHDTYMHIGAKRPKGRRDRKLNKRHWVLTENKVSKKQKEKWRKL